MTVGKSKSALNRFFAPRPTPPPGADDGVTLAGTMQLQYIKLRAICHSEIMRTVHGRIMNYASTHHLIRARENRSTNVQNTIMLDARYLNLEKKTPQ